MFNPIPFDDMHGFSDWLQSGGAEVLPPTNPWEILRVRTSEGVFVAYRNNKGRETWPPRLRVLRDEYRQGKDACSLAPAPPEPLRPSRPMVTIFADASFHPETRAAGWACWIKAGPEGSHQASGPIESAVSLAREAELCALATALAVARSRGLLAHGKVAMLQSDCIHALALIRALVPDVADRPVDDGRSRKIGPIRKPHPSDVERIAVEAITEIVEATGVSLVTRHIKGHQRRGGGREWVNRECDRLARAAMRLRKQEIEGTANV